MKGHWLIFRGHKQFAFHLIWSQALVHTFSLNVLLKVLRITDIRYEGQGDSYILFTATACGDEAKDILFRDPGELLKWISCLSHVSPSTISVIPKKRQNSVLFRVNFCCCYAHCFNNISLYWSQLVQFKYNFLIFGDWNCAIIAGVVFELLLHCRSRNLVPRGLIPAPRRALLGARIKTLGTRLPIA
jgi:hypothetical protein